MLPTVTDHKLAPPAHPVTAFAAVLVVDGLRFPGRHAYIVARGYDIHASIVDNSVIYLAGLVGRCRT
jgi:hypothetical protein